MSGFVYFARCKGFIKIGSAVDVGNRISTLQTGNPFEIEFVGQAKFKTIITAQQAERYLHRKLVRDRVRGEWFHGCVMDRVVDLIGDRRNLVAWTFYRVKNEPPGSIPLNEV